MNRPRKAYEAMANASWSLSKQLYATRLVKPDTTSFAGAAEARVTVMAVKATMRAMENIFFDAEEGRDPRNAEVVNNMIAVQDFYTRCAKH
jgi:hypothetical protein